MKTTVSVLALAAFFTACGPPAVVVRGGGAEVRVLKDAQPDSTWLNGKVASVSFRVVQNLRADVLVDLISSELGRYGVSTTSTTTTAASADADLVVGFSVAGNSRIVTVSWSDDDVRFFFRAEAEGPDGIVDYQSRKSAEMMRAWKDAIVGVVYQLSRARTSARGKDL